MKMETKIEEVELKMWSCYKNNFFEIEFFLLKFLQ